MTDTVIALPTPTPSNAPAGADVKRAVGDAKLLLSYVTENGRSIDDKSVRTIVEAAQLVSAGSLTVDQEIAFWTAYREVASTAAPTSVASLRATVDLPTTDSVKHAWFGHPSSPARQTVRYYTAWVILVLVVLLTVQVYQLFGATASREIQTLSKEYDALIVKRQAATAKGVSGQLELSDISAAFENLQLRQRASYDLLMWWSNRLPDWVAPVPAPTTASMDTVLANRLAVQQRALMVNDALQRYVLPLLYGLLGSCVYVLRTLATQIRTRSYIESVNIDFRLRTYTGALSGLVVGWFFSGDSSSVITTLQPNALAFLAGYSVDLLFSAMDRILNAFSSPLSNSESARRPTK